MSAPRHKCVEEFFRPILMAKNYLNVLFWWALFPSIFFTFLCLIINLLDFYGQNLLGRLHMGEHKSYHFLFA
jgi:hypothetical protein